MFNYGGRDELIKAFQNLVKDGKCDENLTEEMVSDYLYTSGIPDPEVIIRSSGVNRLSNFLLWQSSYSEIFFVDELWPDFDQNILYHVIRQYINIDRKFGGVND